jgi:hypothetical protein
VDDFRQVTGLDQLTGDDTITLARTAAEAIRGLNHATGCDAGLGQPSAAYDILGALSLAASRLPQLLTQIAGYLDRALAAGRLGHDLGKDPAPAIGAAVVFLEVARGSAAALAATSTPRGSSSPPSTATPQPPAGRTTHDRQDPAPLRIHRHAVRP